MEYLEHRAGGSAEKFLKRSGQFGSVLGSALGILPQCGFSSAAAGLYSARVISIGTLIAVFLSTSDEMVPIFIVNGNLTLMIKVLAVKFVIALVSGLAIDLILNAIYKKRGVTPTPNIEEICERDNCHCKHDILKSALVHTGKVTLFIFIFSFVLNFLVYFVGESNIALLILNKPVIANILAAIVGLIPNCASSVVISELFLDGMLSAGALISGLLVNSGVALAVLFRANRPRKNTLAIMGILLAISIVAGIVIDLTPLGTWLAV
ncbi:MAG: arsenic efflux protein [Clostridia bacterium]|nr:arsenic efflux protein [Clostridia bacterium]